MDADVDLVVVAIEDVLGGGFEDLGTGHVWFVVFLKEDWVFGSGDHFGLVFVVGKLVVSRVDEG